MALKVLKQLLIQSHASKFKIERLGFVSRSADEVGQRLDLTN